MIRVLFVCLGNICRSPMAEGVFRKRIQEAGLQAQVEIDSAGTHAFHIGKSPDGRAQAAAARRGVDISMLCGRQADEKDFLHYDYVLAMDHENYEHLRALCPFGQETKLRLFLEFATRTRERAVPDPYYGTDSGFDRVLDMIEDAAEGLLADVRRRLAQ